MHRRTAFLAFLLTPAAAAAQEANPFPFLNQQAPARDVDPAEALARWLRVLGDDPNNVAALEGAGRAALECGDPSSSIGFWARANRLAPSDGTIKAGLAAALVQAEQPKLALKYFDQATALGVPEAEIAGDRGLAYDLQGNNRRAQQDYRAALKGRADNELTQRLALSLAMSGDRPGALALLDPLLRQQDRAAWRTRAFVRALTGDVAGANGDARSVLPAAQAQQIAPFLARLASLTHEQQAAAVNFGEIPQASRPATTLDLAREAERPLPVPQRTVPPVLAAATPPTGAARATDFAGRPTGTLASATPRPAAPVTLPPRPATISEPSLPTRPTTPASTTVLASADLRSQPSVASRAAAATSVPAVGRPAVPASLLSAQTPTAPSPAVAGTTPPSLALPGTASPSTSSAAPTVLALAEPAPARLPVGAPPAPAGGNTTPTPGFDGFGAKAPSTTPASPPLGQDVAAAIARTPDLSAASAPPSAAAAEATPPALTAPTGTGPLPPATAAVRQPEAPPAERLRPQPLRPPPHAPARAQTLAAQTLGAQALAVGAVMPESGERVALNLQPSGLLRPGRAAAGAHPDTTDAVDPGARPAVVETGAAGHHRSAGREEAADAPAPTKKPDAATQRAAAAKAKLAAADAAKAKQDAADAAKEKAAAKAAPSRVWVQVAGGAYKADLGKAWGKLKKTAPDLYAGKSPSTMPFRYTNRLLVGPFKDADEAQDYVNRLTKGGQSGFVVKTPAGQKVEKVEE